LLSTDEGNQTFTLNPPAKELVMPGRPQGNPLESWAFRFGEHNRLRLPSGAANQFAGGVAPAEVQRLSRRTVTSTIEAGRLHALFDAKGNVD
jgi:hypothetical protein